MEDFETTTIVLLPSRPSSHGRIRYMKMSSFERLIANFRSTNQGQLVSKGTSTMDYQESLSHGVVSENAEQASIAVTDKACQTEPPDYPKKMPPLKPSGTALPVQRTATVEPCLPSSNDTKSSEDALKEQQDGHRCNVNTVALRILKCQLTRLQRLVSIVKSRRPTEMNIFLLSYVQLLTRLIDNLLDSESGQLVALQIFESIVASGLARKRLWRVISNPRMPVPADALQYPKENQPKFGESQTPREFNHHHHQKPNTNYRNALCNYVGSDGRSSSIAKMHGRMMSGRSTQVVQRADRNRYGQGHGVKMTTAYGNNHPPRHFNHWCTRDQRGYYPPLMQSYAGVKLAKPHYHHAKRGRYY